MGDCLKRQAYICFLEAHGMFAFDNEILETLIGSETPYISEFSEYKCYDWVKYRDQQIVFPEDNFVLGRYLAPSFDIEPAMTT